MMGSNAQNKNTASESRLDIGWEHARKVDNDSRKIQCIYCNAIMLANINRFKHHLACTKQYVKACSSVPSEVKEKMFRKLKEFSRRKIMNDEEEGMGESVPHKRGKRITIGTTQSILNQNSEKKLRDEACSQIDRFFCKIDSSLNCAKNPDIAKKFDFVGKYGSESSLENEMKNTTNMLEKYKIEWKKRSCSIICDEWTNMKGRFYCNFLVNCSGRTIFLKSMDISDFPKIIIKVFRVLDKIVEEVGEENVVQVITKNTTNYKAVVELLMYKRKGIFWSPCVVELLDEILEDFEKNLLYHHITIAKGKKISTFIDSRTKVFSKLKYITNCKELIGPIITPSATAYLNLLYLIDIREPLIEMFSSELELTNTKEGEEIQQIIQDCEFWYDAYVCLNLALPIIEVFLKINCDEKSTVGFIYEEMKCAKESLQSLNNAKGYDTIWKIINERSDPLLHPLYTTSYYLNPRLCYGSAVPRESILQLCADLAKMAITFNDNSEITAENLLQLEHQFADFSASKGLFGSQIATMQRYRKDPAEWWSLYGNDCPELQRIAIRLLSLTCSFCGSVQSQNAYEQVYPNKRSHLYRKKLNELFLKINKFKLKTHKLKFTNILPEVRSSGNERKRKLMK